MSIVRSRLFGSLAVFALALPALPSCREIDPAFCAAHPQDVDCAGAGAGIDAGMCIGNDQCAYPTPVCDMNGSMCVSCTADDPGSCGGTAPVCGDDHACRGCAIDDDCASQTCLPDGACAALLDVLYAMPGGSDMATCMPGDRCSLGRALALIDGTKSTIRLDPGHYDLSGALTLPNDLRLVGRGAILDRGAAGSSSGGVLDLASGTSIALDYVEVQGGTGSAGFGIRCINASLALREVTVTGNAGPGITGSGCSLAISHARIAANQGIGVAATDGTLALARSQVIGNAGGGVAVTRATYDVENDLIAGDGDADSLFGGVLITQISAASAHVFAFNTVADNQAAAGTTPGVLCGIIALPLVLTSSIVVGAAGAQVDGAGCSWTYSDIAPVAAPGTGNRSIDPGFVDPEHGDFHLQAASPVRDAADPTAALAVDIDGEPRPQGAGREPGADEIP